MKKYEIVFEDSDLFVICKCAGLACQSGRPTEPDLMSFLKNECLERGEREPYLALINRLDQPVEGLLLVAKNARAAAFLSEQAREHAVVPGNLTRETAVPLSTGAREYVRMEKEYRALVRGGFQEEEGTLVDFLLRDGRTNTSRVVPPETKGAKRSELAYRVLENGEDTSLLEIHLKTGRHHQIRVQLAHAGHPIVGDFKYGEDTDPRQKDEASDAGYAFSRSQCRSSSARLGLCACRLCFTHPGTGERMEFRAEPSFSHGNDSGRKA
ncbi:MAG: RluA family pseudouridine synthase [Lachnospiraceae bacterium]|nr:RluA family pseudouridine synthase [Lachnospiraceae bacterium]